MRESIGFRIPKATVNRFFLQILIPCAVVTPVLWLLGIGTVASALETLAFVKVICAGGYWHTLKYKWVYLSPDGVKGMSPSGVNVVIPWSAPVTLKYQWAFSGIKCIALKDADQKHVLMIPEAIAETPDFKESVKLLAPAQHPLLLSEDYLALQ